MKADQERVRMLISQTITMLCKKGLEFETELKVQGLLGVTVDSRDIFLIHLNEKYDNVSDTKDVLPRQDSVATSTGNERTQFSPQDISPDNGTTCETAYQLGMDGFAMKRELQPVSPLHPNFPEFQDSMSDLFPYAECHTTESTLLTNAGCDNPGFLMDANPSFSTNMPPDLKDIGMGDKFTDHGGGGGSGVILLDSGDEAEQDFKPHPQSLHQLNFGASEMDSKGGIQMIPEHKMALQSSYAPEMFRPSNTPNIQNQQQQQNAEMEQTAGSSQAWALQPVSRSQFPLHSPGQMNPQGQRMPFNPEHIGKFTIGSNRPPAVMPSGFRGRGTSRRPGNRQPRPTMRGCRGLVSPMKPMIPNDDMGIRHSGSPTAGGMMLGSPPLTSFSPGTSRPARGSPSVRGAQRGRSPRVPGAMLRGAAAGSSAMMEFASGVAAGSSGNQSGAPRMARGSLSVRARSVDGYSYGKQTVTNYICNICNAVYKNHSSLLTHQVKVHGRQKKEGMGRPRMRSTYEQEDDSSEEEMGEM